MKKITLHYHAEDHHGKNVDISVEAEGSYEVYYELEDLLKRDLLQWAKPPVEVSPQPEPAPVPQPPAAEVEPPTPVDRDEAF